MYEDSSVSCPPDRDPRYPKVCEQCGHSFFKPRNVTPKSWLAYRFCGMACKGLGLRKANIVLNEHGRKYDRRFPRNCEVCGTEYYKSLTMSLAKWEQSRFCSQSCVAKGCQNGKETRIKPGSVPPNKLPPGQLAANIRAQHARWRAANREHVNAESRRRYFADLERSREQARKSSRAYAERQGEALKERRRQYRKINRDRERATQNAWRRANPEKAKANVQRYKDRHPEKVKEWKQRGHIKRKALLRGATQFGPIDIAYIRHRDKDICQICGKPCAEREMTFDHIIPLSKGGPHTNANLQVAHGLCNSRKGTGYLPTQIRLPFEEKI